MSKKTCSAGPALKGSGVWGGGGQELINIKELFLQIEYKGHISVQLSYFGDHKIDGKYFLRISDQPSGLTALDKGLSWYRKKCLDVKFSG
ncbi:hypothetical protein RDI58_026737 [Solanum bulbocastanum]|uniref:Uncharacterized protein n=1 Tax=Solanum bulbocastanum TaxID=147425 RepID=A0AAN8Y1G5_SOLBU